MTPLQDEQLLRLKAEGILNEQCGEILLCHTNTITASLKRLRRELGRFEGWALAMIFKDDGSKREMRSA